MSPALPRCIGIASTFPDSSPFGIARWVERLRARLPSEKLVGLPRPATSGQRLLPASSGVLAAVIAVTTRADRRGHALRLDGTAPQPVRVVFVDGDGAAEAAIDKSVSEMAGWILAVRSDGRAGPGFPRPRLRLADGPVTRRQLLAWDTRSADLLVPVIHATRCAGGSRCGLCAERCPEGALAAQGDRVVLDAGRCTACAACIRACPVDAIQAPGGSKLEIDACLRGMLAAATTPAPARIVAFTCSRWSGLLPPPYLECQLPCVELVSAWAILRALHLGAHGVAVVIGDSPCADRHQEHACGEVEIARTILGALGVEPGRVVRLDSARDASPSAFAAALEGLGPAASRDGSRTGQVPRPLGRLLAAMVRSASGTVAVPAATPLGSVEVDPRRCSLCGVCALCPTGALVTFDEEDRAGLGFDHAACTACDLCRRACPENAIRVTRVLDTARLLGGPRDLVLGQVARCETCSSPIAPAPLLDVLARRIAARGGTTAVPAAVGRLCPACRLFPADRPV